MTGVKVIADYSIENASKAQGVGLTWSVVVDGRRRGELRTKVK